MKRMTAFLAALVCVLGLASCTKSQDIADDTCIPSESALSTNNEILKYLSDKYAMRFNLRYSDGHDLYVVYIFPDHAERSCDLLMPANTDDVSSHDKNLSWEVDGYELIITGEVEESFRIDISTETATSTSTGKVYRIIEPTKQEAVASGDLIPMVFIDRMLYCDNSEESSRTERVDAFDGEITSTVKRSEIPTEDNQSNFGTGYGYQYGPHGTIEILINGEWRVFAIMADAV